MGLVMHTDLERAVIDDLTIEFCHYHHIQGVFFFITAICFMLNFCILRLGDLNFSTIDDADTSGKPQVLKFTVAKVFHLLIRWKVDIVFECFHKCGCCPFQDSGAAPRIDLEEMGKHLNGEIMTQPEEGEEDEGAMRKRSRRVGFGLWSSSVGGVVQCWFALHNKCIKLARLHGD